MKTNKIALITIGEENVEISRRISNIFTQLNMKYDWYFYSLEIWKDLRLEIEDLKEAYPAVYII